MLRTKPKGTQFGKRAVRLTLKCHRTQHFNRSDRSLHQKGPPREGMARPRPAND